MHAPSPSTSPVAQHTPLMSLAVQQTRSRSSSSPGSGSAGQPQRLSPQVAPSRQLAPGVLQSASLTHAGVTQTNTVAPVSSWRGCPRSSSATPQQPEVQSLPPSPGSQVVSAGHAQLGHPPEPSPDPRPVPKLAPKPRLAAPWPASGPCASEL